MAAFLMVFVGFPILGLAWMRRKWEVQFWGLDVGGASAEVPAPRQREAALNVLLKHDPGFSLVLFEDFAYTLYTASQRARHDPRALAGLAPYWTSAAMASLAARAPRGGRVDAVVVGSLTPGGGLEGPGQIWIDCSFESNLHIEVAPRPVTQYVQETWTFSRAQNAKTRPWTGVRNLGCPNCGAPRGGGVYAVCAACGQAVGDGRFDWQVVSMSVNNVEEKPHSLTGTSEEVGTDAPTRFSPNARHDLDALLRNDPALSRASIEARLRLIFDTMQSAWAAQDLRPLRPFVSDRQYDYLQYWIDAYRAQGLRNLMRGPRLERFVCARVSRDTHYDALILRVWGSGCDHTIEEKSGRVVGGSRTVPRRYSEYWTLIRSARATGPVRLDHNCPGCGVPLTLNMAGGCEHCGAHVTSGEFDWVLSKIEQDEAYQG